MSGKERSADREGELNADCESFSNDLTNFTILERADVLRTNERASERIRERKRGTVAADERKIRRTSGKGDSCAAPLKLRMHSHNRGGAVRPR